MSIEDLERNKMLRQREGHLIKTRFHSSLPTDSNKGKSKKWRKILQFPHISFCIDIRHKLGKHGTHFATSPFSPTHAMHQAAISLVFILTPASLILRLLLNIASSYFIAQEQEYKLSPESAVCLLPKYPHPHRKPYISSLHGEAFE